MSSAARTLGITVAASLGLHGGLLLLAAGALTVLPAWTAGPGRSPGRKLHAARAFKAGDKYLLSCRMETEIAAPVPYAGKMLVTLRGLWEIQEVTPHAGQPVKYRFTVDDSGVVAGERAAVLFVPGAVIAGFVDASGAPSWTLDGTKAEGALLRVLRSALPVPAARDTDELAACVEPPDPVKTGDRWAVHAPAVAERVTRDGAHLTGPVEGGVTLSGPLVWEEGTFGRQLDVRVSFQADFAPGVPEGAELRPGTVKGEAEIFLPDDVALPVLREKWVLSTTTEGKLPMMAAAAEVSITSSVEREISLPNPDKAAEPQEVEVTFVPQVEVPSVTAKLPKAAEPDKNETKPAQAQGPIHIVTREDIPSVAPFESDTPFISDRNTRAAATNAPVKGANPRLGSQEGVDISGLSLFDAQANPGGRPTPPPPPPSARAVIAETPPAPPPPAGDDRPPETATVRTDDRHAPAPRQNPGKTPELRERPPDPIKLSDAKPRPVKQPAVPAPPVPKNPSPGGKPVVSSVKSEVKGSLAVRGDDSSVDAKDTPEGRFYSGLHDSIGLIWNTRLAAVHGLTGSGVVEVEFDIDINGRISNVKLLDPGKANPVLEDVCLTSVIKAKVPALPPSIKRELQDPLTGGKLHQKINFYKIPPR